MAEPTSVPNHHARAVRLWLLCVAAMIFLTLLVGGATRLTESGLSITQWKPVTGVVPPLSDAAWQAEFNAYRAIPQYNELNRGMSLDQFKVIYWWEWTHRLLARATGAVFLLPFLFFLWRGWVPPRLRIRLWAIFGAGAFLGAVGWWMVASGLAGSGRVNVSQYRLAFHLTLACAIYAAVLVDRAADHAAAGGWAAGAAADWRARHCCAGADANLSRRAGRRARRRSGLQYLAADRRLVHSGPVAPVVLASGLAQFFREHAHRSVRPPHDGLCDLARGDVSCQRRLGHAARDRRRADSRRRGDLAACARRRHTVWGRRRSSWRSRIRWRRSWCSPSRSCTPSGCGIVRVCSRRNRLRQGQRHDRDSDHRRHRGDDLAARQGQCARYRVL